MFVDLTKGHRAQFDEADAALVMSHKWHVVLSGGLPYAVTRVGDRKLKMHRLLTNAPNGFVVDHINHDTLDNRRQNLRVVTHAYNSRNSARAHDGGVWQCNKTGRWMARASLDKKRVFLGRFMFEKTARETVQEARVLYDTGIAIPDIQKVAKAKARKDLYASSLALRAQPFPAFPQEPQP